ncbi:hypothetical protein [Geomonas anaerohicana]|uniref:Fibronectin type-III domain-containing protein n=1 Tax=Geomonas anaerohicana TaxID=2798583 RepID=A0ABS0YIB9_9BACT|nr:hypothetical protein [Geomonas anaerohicana]MBJ6752070.1 hypothetical protein [Geomonas anaerohicana]
MPVIPELLAAHYQDLAINEFIAFMLFHAERMDAHAVIKEGAPEYFSDGQRLREIAANLRQLRDSAATGNREAKAKKLEVWEEGKLAVAMNVQHITMLSLHRKDPTILQETGLELKQKQHIMKTSLNLLTEIPVVTVKHVKSPSGPVPGAVTVIITRPKNAPCELQMSTDPSNEGSWGGQGIHQKVRIQYQGLEPASRVYFRARLHVDGKTGPWSQVATIIVL